jgi:hypothetical protein
LQTSTEKWLSQYKEQRASKDSGSKETPNKRSNLTGTQTPTTAAKSDPCRLLRWLYRVL